MKDFYISKNLYGLRLSPCAWNQNIHIHNRGRRCLEHCCWTRVFDDDVKIRGNTLRVGSDGCDKGIRVSAMVCDNCSIDLHIAWKLSSSWKTNRCVGSCWTWLSKCKRNCLITRWTLRYSKRNRVRLRGYPNLDCLCRWNRSAESQGSNDASNNYVETVSYWCHSCWEVRWVHCKNKRMWS